MYTGQDVSKDWLKETKLGLIYKVILYKLSNIQVVLRILTITPLSEVNIELSTKMKAFIADLLEEEKKQSNEGFVSMHGLSRPITIDSIFLSCVLELILPVLNSEVTSGNTQSNRLA